MESTVARGGRYEALALKYLKKRGYRIVEQNFRCRAGEIDIVARQGGDLVFVEVRSRKDGERGRAEETVSFYKQRRIARVAEAYLLARRPRFSTCRFDVVGITGDEIVLIRDAFRV